MGLLSRDSRKGRDNISNVPRVTSTPDADTVILRWGEDGTPYSVREGDEEAGGIAFIKCVAEGLARGDVIEDETEMLVAKALLEDATFLTILPMTGDISLTRKGVVWSQEEGLSDLQADLGAQLPAYNGQTGESWYVQDISADGTKALICHYGGQDTEYFVAPIADGRLAAKTSWEAVDQAYVSKNFPTTGNISTTKAGRVLSGSNLSALQAIHEAVGAVISAEMTRRQDPTGNEGNEEEEPAEKALDYIVTKADPEQMYTFGPLYAPDRKDAHGEYTDSDTLAKAVHAYVQSCVDKGDNRLNIQHSDDGAAGRWVEVCAWPYESTVKMKVPGEDPREVTLPAGTIYMGIQWEPNVWPDVKKGKLTGLSLGGRAMRVVSDDNPTPMGDKEAAAVCDQYSPGDNGMCANCGQPQDAHDSGDPS